MIYQEKQKVLALESRIGVLETNNNTLNGRVNNLTAKENTRNTDNNVLTDNNQVTHAKVVELQTLNRQL